MKQYLNGLKYILENGEERKDRTGIGTKSVFGYQMRFNLQKGFPAVTTKKLAWKAVVGELLWMLEGSTDERRLAEITFEKSRYELVGKSTIWTANADTQGKSLGHINNDHEKWLGPVYGYQWRYWSPFVDQISNVLESLKTDPYGRRHIVSSWNAESIPTMALPPCHILFQFYVYNGKLSCQLYQRSADAFLGVPFNIASYSLLIHMFAQILNLDVGEFIWTVGDFHIYLNHIDQVEQQIKRKSASVLPILRMPKFSNLDELLKTVPGEYKLLNYNPMPSIKAPMAV